MSGVRVYFKTTYDPRVPHQEDMLSKLKHLSQEQCSKEVVHQEKKLDLQLNTSQGPCFSHATKEEHQEMMEIIFHPKGREVDRRQPGKEEGKGPEKKSSKTPAGEQNPASQKALKMANE